MILKLDVSKFLEIPVKIHNNAWRQNPEDVSLSYTLVWSWCNLGVLHVRIASLKSHL